MKHKTKQVVLKKEVEISEFAFDETRAKCKTVAMLK